MWSWYLVAAIASRVVALGFSAWLTLAAASDEMVGVSYLWWLLIVLVSFYNSSLCVYTLFGLLVRVLGCVLYFAMRLFCVTLFLLTVALYCLLLFYCCYIAGDSGLVGGFYVCGCGYIAMRFVGFMLVTVVGRMFLVCLCLVWVWFLWVVGFWLRDLRSIVFCLWLCLIVLLTLLVCCICIVSYVCLIGVCYWLYVSGWVVV